MEKVNIILAGDVGGTKTLLALFNAANDLERPIAEERFASRDYNALAPIIGQFLKKNGNIPIQAASFGVAGRIIGRQCQPTNLPWLIDADRISQDFEIPHVHLVNDIQAIATAVPHLKENDLFKLNNGRKDPSGVIGVIAPGTGLGESFLTWGDGHYHAWSSEGGHASFAPITPEQLELLEYLERRFGHVSFERVCSGSGFPNIYDYLVATGRYEEPDWLRGQLIKAKDPTPIIMNAGYERKAAICINALDLFVRILGSVLGNMALKVNATGGLYLGGGIPPRIIHRLQKRDFLDAICYKGRFRDWLSLIPVFVILDSKAALHGAAWHAIDNLKK